MYWKEYGEGFVKDNMELFYPPLKEQKDQIDYYIVEHKAHRYANAFFKVLCGSCGLLLRDDAVPIVFCSKHICFVVYLMRLLHECKQEEI